MMGAYDLSKLKSAGGSPSTSSQTNQIKVPALIFEGAEQNIRAVLELSAKLPVLVEFYSGSNETNAFSSMLANIVESKNGQIILVRVNVTAQQPVAEAFGVQQAPTLVALIGGQPVPLFEGAQDQQTVAGVLDQIQQVAASRGLNAVAIPEASEPTVEDLPPLHQAAFEAISRGDYAAAIASYEKALVDNPRDDLATAGLAQVKLLQRTENLDPSALSAQPPAEFSKLLEWVDGKFAMGEYDEAFDALLEKFASETDRREEIRARLLELFATVEPGNESVIRARRKLANLLY